VWGCVATGGVNAHSGKEGVVMEKGGWRGKRSSSPKSCPSGADVEKGEVSCPSVGRTPVSEPVGDPGQQPCHRGSALRVDGPALPSVGITDTLKSCGSLGKTLFF